MKPLRQLQLDRITKNTHPLFRHRVLQWVQYDDEKVPIHGFVIGSKDPTKPTVGLFGGVHGLERIGAEVVLSYLASLNEQLSWDADLRQKLNYIRIVSIPIVNPVGIINNWRSNGNGVDLMRNAPVESSHAYPFVGGHRFSKWLPYYRGQTDKMEIEAETLVKFVKKEMFHAPASLSIDFHSGFGIKDRLWYPYARSKEDFPLSSQVSAIKNLLHTTNPHHVYQIEPQSDSYTTHGDLWDYLFDDHFKNRHPKGQFFIPWTMEMGSWSWIRKNPRQIFSLTGIFDPIKPHRKNRIMRRHVPLIDFFTRAIRNHKIWTKQNDLAAS